MKKATIKDIALLAGVNPSTVSRALKDHPDISTDVREKIKAIATQLKYTPNLAAINLRSKNSKVIGLVIPDINMYFMPSVISGITQLLHQFGFNILVLNSQDNIEKETENIRICCNHGVDGILLSVTNQTTNYNHLQIAYEQEIPIVLFDKTIKQNVFDEVNINDSGAALQCANYLIDKHCKHVLLVLGNPQLKITKDRELAINKALNAKKIFTTPLYANNSMEAYSLTCTMLQNDLTIDGIFGMSDETMVGINAALYQNNKKIHTVVISDGQLPALMTPPMTYVKHDGYALGTLAAKVLLKHIQDSNYRAINQPYWIDTEIIQPTNNQQVNTQ
jgi:LacI family transcriptional regulator